MGDDLLQLSSVLGDSTGSGSGYAIPQAPAPVVDSSGNSMMPSLPMALNAGGSILSAYGDIMAGQESQAADDYNASLALEQGQFAVSEMQVQEADVLSTQNAMYAKAGVTMSGSPLDTALNTATQFELDKQTSIYNAQAKADMYKYEGQVAKIQSQFKAAGALFQGAESIGMLALLEA